jgi:hypothetical protein
MLSYLELRLDERLREFRDAPLWDTPLRDAPLRDAPLRGTPLQDAPLRDATGICCRNDQL